MTIEHRAGSKHRNADALRRIPCRKMCCLETKSRVYSISCQSSESSTSLKAKQSEDKDIKQVLKWVASGVKPNSEELSSYGQFVKALYSQWDDLKVVDEILYKSKTCTNGKISLRAVLPYSERRAVLSQYHDECTSAHLGFKKTLGKIKAKFYWPGLQKRRETIRCWL